MSRLVSTSTRSIAVPLAKVFQPPVEALHRPQVAAADLFGLGQQLLGDLQADELRHAVELERQLVVVHHLEQDHFVLPVTHLLQGGLQRRQGR